MAAEIRVTFFGSDPAPDTRRAGCGEYAQPRQLRVRAENDEIEQVLRGLAQELKRSAPLNDLLVKVNVHRAAPLL